MFVTRNPTYIPWLLDFIGNNVNKDSYDYVIISDSSDEKYKDIQNVFQVDKRECTNKGYQGSYRTVAYLPNVLAMDKAMYYLGEINQVKYKYYWFIEEDVYFKKGALDYIDNNKQYLNYNVITHFQHRRKFLTPALRLTHNIIELLLEYKRINNKNIDFEKGLPKLLQQYNIQAHEIDEYRTVRWKTTWKHLYRRPANYNNNIFHPVKKERYKSLIEEKFWTD